jgi:hypothetical protein
MKRVSPLRVKALGSFFLSLWLAFPVGAQQSPQPPANQDEVNKQLLQRLQELEDEVKQLKAQSAATAPAAPVMAAPLPVPAPSPVPEPEMPTVNEVAPRLHLNVFGDVGYEWYNHVPNTFEFGSLDLFMTARLSDKVSTLGEVLFIAESGNGIGVDVERLLLRYRQSDYLNASIGRMHTWVGYYNTAFNKGEFLETTIDRPFIYAFDDEGGILPMQDVGVNLTGKIPSGKLGLNYVFEVGNGRGWGGPNVEPAQNYQDANNSKSVNGGLFMRPDKVPGLQLGFSILHDNLSLPGPPAVGESIATVHAVYVNSKYEILNEGVLVKDAETGGPTFHTGAFYSQFSRAFHAWRPYFRYQYFNANSGDPVYAYTTSPNAYVPLDVTGFVGRLNGPSAGVRWDFTEHSALKLQYDRYSFRGLATENGLTSQFAFTF